MLCSHRPNCQFVSNPERGIGLCSVGRVPPHTQLPVIGPHYHVIVMLTIGLQNVDYVICIYLVCVCVCVCVGVCVRVCVCSCVCVCVCVCV